MGATSSVSDDTLEGNFSDRINLQSQDSWVKIEKPQLIDSWVVIDVINIETIDDIEEL